MNNSMIMKSIVIVVIMLFLSINNILRITADEPPKNRMIYVDDDNIMGPWDGSQKHPYQHILEGVLNAIDGDTVYVLSGEYHENIVIDKTISLYGENRSSTVIDGMYSEVIIHTIEDGVAIEQFTIRNSGGFIGNAGIKLDSNYNIVNKCTIYRTKTGVYVNETKNNEINNCTFYTNGEGIHLRSSNRDKVQSCYFSQNAFGLNIKGCNGIEITDCYANTNSIGYFFDNSSNIKASKCAAYNNNDNGGGLYFSSCYNINISDCIIDHNGFGITTSDCLDVYITNSDLFWNTHSGFHIEEYSKNIEIKNCKINENFRFGIYIENSKCNLVNNNINNSLFDIYSENSLCDARNNWWGSSLGPTLMERTKNCRIFLSLVILDFFHGLLKKLRALVRAGMLTITVII